jgi:hypothetical protein
MRILSPRTNSPFAGEIHSNYTARRRIFNADAASAGTYLNLRSMSTNSRPSCLFHIDLYFLCSREIVQACMLKNKPGRNQVE